MARPLAKRIVAGIYSFAADRIYEPVVIRGTFRWFGGHLEPLVAEQGRRAVEVAAGRPILDLPVGTAHFTMPTARAHPGLVAGVDIARGMVVAARRAASEAGIGNLVAVQADAHRLPFASGAFGAVMCTNGLQVMPGLSQTLAELRRVVAADGRLFVSVVNLPVLSARRAPAMFASRSALGRALQDAGFEVLSVATARLATLYETRPAPPA